MTLFVTDSPTNRARLGAADGVMEALVALVDSARREAVSSDPHVAAPPSVHRFEAAESAAEAMWTLAYNSAANHAALVRLGAVEALAAMVTARDALGLATPPRAAMWAAAALQNLAASYCETADGRCTWSFERGEPESLVPDAAVVVDAEDARRRIAHQPVLIEALVRYVCEGPVGPTDGGGAPWPSKATVSSRNAPSTVPWAAAGLLKNLALSEAAAERVLRSTDAGACLCRLSRSRDWIESSKANAALRLLQPRAAARAGGGGFACDEPHDEL